MTSSFESIYSFHMGSLKASGADPPASCDLPYWLAVQTALLCVNSKLRSPLGKPQDTFLSIEGLIDFDSVQILFSKRKIVFQMPSRLPLLSQPARRR